LSRNVDHNGGSAFLQAEWKPATADAEGALITRDESFGGLRGFSDWYSSSEISSPEPKAAEDEESFATVPLSSAGGGM